MGLITAVLVTAFGTPAEVTRGEVEVIERELGVRGGRNGLIIKTRDDLPLSEAQIAELIGGE